MNTRGRVLCAAALAIAVLVPAGTASAVISGTSGALTKILPPASIGQSSGLASVTTNYAWDEQQGVTLASPLTADITQPGNYDSFASDTIGTIPAGTVVDSHYFEAIRPPGTGTTALTSTLTFPTDILGIMVVTGKVHSSDILGAPGTDYTVTGSVNYGLELSPTGDAVSVPNLRTVTITASAASDNQDDVRIITKHDAAPVVNAGGPYAGNEGSTVTLHGSAVDPENDPVQSSWTFNTTAAKPGTVCTPAATNTLTPTITCNDDAVITATLSSIDPYHSPVTSSAQITFSNVPPVMAALSAPTGQIPLASTVNVSGSFTDAGTNDTHTAQINWGDTTSSAATVTEANGSGTLAGSHVYSSPGLYTITVTTVDDDLGQAVKTVAVAINGPPVVNAGGPYSGTEGTTAGLLGTASDPEHDPLTTNWTITPTAEDPGTTCTTTGTTTLTPSVTCNDDAVLSAGLSANDGVNAPTVANTTITINNVAPVIGTVTATAGPIPVGSTVAVSAPFTDAGTNDTHTATVNWGDMSTTNASIAESNGSGTLSSTHSYAHAGLYTVTITLQDDNGGTDVSTAQILINTPPTVSAGGPYVGFEGSQMLLSATANDLDNDPLTYSWTFTSTGGPGTTCAATGAGTHSPTLTLVCNDDAVVTATISVSDGVNAPVQSTATLTVGNVAPTAGALAQSPTAPGGSTVAISVPFSDPGTNDTHTATIDWGDSTTSAGIVTETNGSGTVTGSHLYSPDGHYNVTVTITDDDGGQTVVTGGVLSDTTPPVITPSVSPAPNAAGWNNSPTTVSWTTVDPLSALSSTTGCDPTTRSTDTDASGVVYTCTATSPGGTATKSVTVKLDQVAPSLAGAATTPPNANGWYNAPVTIHWTCSDALSGLATACPADSTLSSEGTAVSASQTVSDVADNVTNAASAPVQIDTHAPVTTASSVPVWNNSDVTLVLNATDNLSGVATTQYEVDGGPPQTGTSVVLVAEGIHTVQYWSTDNAGNVEATNTATVKIDKTAPSITVAQDPTPNVSGWNNSDVTVSFTCGDSLSGVASCTPSQTVTTEGAGQVVAGTAVDNAGNSASASASVSIDKTAPTITGVVPAANGNGWYNAPVTVSWSCADALSGVASCPAPTTLSTDGAAQTLSGTAADAADNSQSATVSDINIDQTPPTISASVSPAPNAGGWNNSTATVHFTCSDATSGVAAGACPADQVVSTEGVTTVSGSVVDRADNAATTSITVRIDTIAPGIVGAQTPAANGAGWNNTDVTVSFNCTDAGSGIATAGCTGPVDVGEGAGQSVTGTAVDLAGNTASATVTGINVDKTPPTLSGVPTTAPNANGWYSAPVTIHWSCSDALSGIAGACPPDSVISTEGTGLTASASVSDVAGNTTTASSSPINIDLTAPSTTASSVPDWSNSSVTLSLSATDNLSGVASTQYIVDGGATQTGTSVSLTAEGVHTVQFWSTDNAGNVEATHTATVKIDKTAPSISVSQSPVANGAGWNNSSVTVSFTCGDSLSGVASCTSPQTVTTEGAGQLVSGSAVDNAGNSASASTTLNVDETPPSITGVIPAANVNGWYNAPVTVSWSCADALSGVASCPSPTTLSTDGAAQSVTATAADTADNMRTATVSGINIDQTAPTLSASAPATPLGWYSTGPVTVHWTCADNLSGVVSCPADQVVTAEGFTTLAQTITDEAGNTATASITIRIDKTPPTIVGTATPPPNAHGWNNTDVNVSFSCADSLSGVVTCSSPTTLHQGTAQSVTGTATDAAGNIGTATVSGINVDETPPTLAGTPTTAPNANGWYNSAVTIHWTCADDRSGVDASTCPANSTVNSEGVAQQVSGTVMDLAGNATTASSTPVKIDLTAPVTSASAVPGSFTNANVSVTLSATDNLSGVAKTEFSVDGGPNQVGTSVTFSTDGVHTLTYFSVDNAGNVESPHVVSVRIDETAPTITATKSPAANGAGWNNSNVTVTFTCGDSLSGIHSCTTPQTVTTEGAGQLVAGAAVDNAGNTAFTSATVSIDKTPPTIASTLSAAPNANGWYKAPVAATFTCNDTLSGLASCPAPVTFGQGQGQTATRTATDIAGNVASATAGPVSVDLTPPTITAAPDRAPDAGSVYTGPVTIHFTCADALSGIATGGCPADQVISNDGTTTVSGTATDRAGNTAAVSATITITIASVRTQKQNLVIQLGQAYSSSNRLVDKVVLLLAENAVAASIDPSLWGTGNTLQVHRGVIVFEAEDLAVLELDVLLIDPGSKVSHTTLNGWITTMTNADRILATTQITASIAAHGTTSLISQAQSWVSSGDALAASGNNLLAINDYKNAWKLAESALGRHCDGGNDPDDQ